MYHGIVNVYKEAGYTSHDVVAKLRGICKQKKIGHTGTLDPDAVGVLPVCLGNATRLCDMLTDKSKEYRAVLRLGLVTDTQDISGKLIEQKEITASTEEIRSAILSFQGESMQLPPMYSALKHNGQKLYELARKGQEIERPARPITVYEIEILKEAHPDYTIRVSCSKGTYIRTICHDIGQRLGCGGVMASLTRTRVGGFVLQEAYTLSQLQHFAEEGKLEQILLPVEEMFDGLLKLTVKPESFRALQNGNQLKVQDLVEGEKQEVQRKNLQKGQEVRLYGPTGFFYGIYRYEEKRGLLCPVKMFLPS